MSKIIGTCLVLCLFGFVSPMQASINKVPSGPLKKGVLERLSEKDLVEGMGFSNKRLHKLSDEVLSEGKLFDVPPKKLAEIARTRAVPAKAEALQRLESEFFFLMTEAEQAEAQNDPLGVYMRLYRETADGGISVGETAPHLKPRHMPMLKFFPKTSFRYISDSDILELDDEQITHVAQLLKESGAYTLGFMYVEGSAWDRRHVPLNILNEPLENMPHQIRLFLELLDPSYVYNFGTAAVD